MTAINPQAIAANLGRPLTEREIRVLMEAQARADKQRPKLPGADKPMGGFTPVENNIRKHLTGKMTALEISAATHHDRDNINKSLKKLEVRGIVGRCGFREKKGSAPVQLWCLKSSLSVMQQKTLDALENGMTSEELHKILGVGKNNIGSHLSGLATKGLIVRGPKINRSHTYALTKAGRAAKA